MKKQWVELGERRYPIYFNNDFNGLSKALCEHFNTSRAVIVTDTNVSRLYGQQCLSIVRDAGIKCDEFVFEPGEKNKNLDTVKSIYEFLMKRRMDRESMLIALGGGVVGDTTGFAAATFLRGIAFVQIPTTLLSQADSSVGGKTGVDFGGSKNIVGAFYQPGMVFINTSTLSTLNDRELASGIAETLKHGLIQDACFFEYVRKNTDCIYGRDPEVLMHIAQNNCRIKASVVESDERETGLRAILNFGHTIGHAVESATGYMLAHGEGVAVGITGAFSMANRLGMVTNEDVELVKRALGNAGLPTKISGTDPDAVYSLMFTDKKVRSGKLYFILPEALGRVIRSEIGDESLVKEVLREVLSC